MPSLTAKNKYSVLFLTRESYITIKTHVFSVYVDLH